MHRGYLHSGMTLNSRNYFTSILLYNIFYLFYKEWNSKEIKL